MHNLRVLSKSRLFGGFKMKVITCSFNNSFFELNIELSPEEYKHSEDEIKEKLLTYANDVLKKFGQSKNINFTKYMSFEEDMSILCVFLVED